MSDPAIKIVKYLFMRWVWRHVLAITHSPVRFSFSPTFRFGFGSRYASGNRFQ